VIAERADSPDAIIDIEAEGNERTEELRRGAVRARPNGERAAVANGANEREIIGYEEVAEVRAVNGGGEEREPDPPAEAPAQTSTRLRASTKARWSALAVNGSACVCSPTVVKSRMSQPVRFRMRFKPVALKIQKFVGSLLHS
jgi:hypothetical protein